jgi:hypothetical protein
VQSGGRTDLTVVFSHPMVYCQLVHYAPRDWTGRLVWLEDQTRELKYEKADTMFRAMKGLSEFFPIRLADYQEFTTRRPEFLLYSDHRDWWPLWALSDEAASIQLLQRDGDMRLYLVKMKKISSEARK